MIPDETWQWVLRATAHRRGIELTSDQEAEIMRRTHGKPVEAGIQSLFEGLIAAEVWNSHRGVVH